MTERVVAEAGLRESQDRFRALVQHSRDLIVVLDDQGRIEDLRSGAERLLELDPEEMRGVEGLTLVHPEDAELAATLLLEMIGTNALDLIHPDDRDQVFEAITTDLTGEPSVAGS